jgi:hypothetical protein
MPTELPYSSQIPDHGAAGREVFQCATIAEIQALLGITMLAKRSFAVTPHAADALPEGTADFLFIGTGGTVVFKTPYDAADVTWTVPSGSYVMCNVSHVRNTGTATGIIACYQSEE